MRHLIVVWLLLVTVSGEAKRYGFIADEETAIRVGRAELIKVYGKKKIEEEEPLTTRVQDGIWTVWGTLWCTDRKGGRTHDCDGGVAEIKLRQSDGEVISIQHTK